LEKRQPPLDRIPPLRGSGIGADAGYLKAAPNRNRTGLAPRLFTSYSHPGRADNEVVKRILILSLTSDEDDGRVARRLQAAVRRASGGTARVDLADPWQQAAGWSERLRRPFGATALRTALLDQLRAARPDVVVVLHPAHASLLAELDRGGRARDFVLAGFVPSAAEGWARTSCDFFIVPNEWVAAGLAPVAPERIKILGYPTVGPYAGTPSEGGPLRVLWILNGARRKAPKLLGRLLERPDWALTLVSDDPEIAARARSLAAPDRLELVADPARALDLLPRHHLVISRPDTALWHEAIAAGCPLVAFRGSTPAELANVDLLRAANAGASAEKPREVVDWIDRADRDGRRVLELWRRNTPTLGRPAGAEAIARFLLEQAGTVPIPALKPAAAPEKKGIPPLHGSAEGDSGYRKKGARGEKKLLLCDLHTHTTWSDGKLTVPELVDFYGQRGFDCLCITDHLCDPQRLLGRLVNLTGLVIPPEKVPAYFAAIEREKKRAWSQYKLLLMAGLEFNHDGYTPKTSAHLLGVDLRQPIDPSLDLPSIIGEIHAQDGLAIASHPHEIKSEWGKNTLYLWEHVEQFAPLLDAWEIANRDDLFNPIGLRKLPFIASSDFHKPKHIQSWKTLLFCEKDPAAIKECIRLNRDVSLTLYRDHRFGLEEREEAATATPAELAPR
jgi:processive 1,2-diacylglycerol beta-glucosyltransferase